MNKVCSIIVKYTALTEVACINVAPNMANGIIISFVETQPGG